MAGRRPAGPYRCRVVGNLTSGEGSEPPGIPSISHRQSRLGRQRCSWPLPLPPLPAGMRSVACLSIATHLGAVSWAVPLPPQAEARSHCQLDQGAVSSVTWREEERDLGSSSDSHSAPSATEKPNPFCRKEGRRTGVGYSWLLCWAWGSLSSSGTGERAGTLDCAVHRLRVNSSSARCELCDLDKTTYLS